MQVTTIAMMNRSICYGLVANFTCPNFTSISPCICSQYYPVYDIPINNTISVNCGGRNLTDQQFSKILNVFLLPFPEISPLFQVIAPKNQLTKIPEQISKFPSLIDVDFSYNKITEIPCVDGKPFIRNFLTNGSIKINLNENLITRIPSGAFNFPFAASVEQSYVVLVEIFLYNNKITLISPDAFRLPSTIRVFLNLGSNQIAVIPNNFFNFPSAVQVNIIMHQNRISQILPGKFHFPMARDEVFIMLDSNEISSVFPGSFNFPPTNYLTTIYLSKNKITDIPCGTFYFPKAQSVGITLESNYIRTIQPGAIDLPSAKFVSISLFNNSLSTISPGTFFFPSVNNYASLNLNDNQISTILPEAFASGIHLVKLNILILTYAFNFKMLNESI